MKFLANFLFFLTVLINLSFAQRSGGYVEMSNNGYVEIENVNSITNTRGFTFDGWINWNGGDFWQRIFDFGFNTEVYMFFTPNSWPNGYPRFGISTSAGNEERIFSYTHIEIGQWTHVAVVLEEIILSEYEYYLDGKIYINGNITGNDILFISPQDLGQTPNNYFGRSQFSVDAFFNGKMDGFRFWNEALSFEDINDLANQNVHLNDSRLTGYYLMNDDANSNQLIDLTNKNSNGILFGNSSIINDNTINFDLTNAFILGLSANDNCEASINGNMVEGIIYDGSEPLVVTVTPQTLILGNNNVTVTADNGNGISGTIEINVNVIDISPPSIVTPQDLTLTLEQDNLIFNPTLPDVLDLCDPSPVLITVPSFPVTFNEPGVFEIIYTATDNSGNSTSVVQTITVENSTTAEINNVKNNLLSISNSVNSTAQQHLNKAVNHLNNVLSPNNWTNGNLLNSTGGNTIFNESKDAFLSIQTATKMGGPNSLNAATKAELNNINTSIYNLNYQTVENRLDYDENNCNTPECFQKINLMRILLQNSYTPIVEVQSFQLISKVYKRIDKNIGKNSNDYEELEKPEKFIVFQNYPNPFNPTTNLRFGLDTESEVKITVFNIVGEQVSELLNEVKSEGFHEITFNASNLPSGLYVIKIFVQSLDGQQIHNSFIKTTLLK